MTQVTEKQAVAESNTGCGPGCSCGSKDPKKPVKAIVSLVVVLIAAFFIVRGFIFKAEAGQGSGQAGFPAVTPASSATGSISGTQTSTSGTGDLVLEWGEPLAAIADLNALAADVNAVFLLLPAGDNESVEIIKQEVQTATVTLSSNGTPVRYFALSENSTDYANLRSQVPVPCVLAMVKGAGSSVVSGEITEENLLQAMVAASRPSSCGPSGCGPSTSGCQ